MIHRRLRATGDAGSSLIEVVLAVLLLATAITALVGGLGTSIIASDMQRKDVTSDSVVRSWAEALDAAPYIACAGTAEASYQPSAVGVTVPPKFTPTIVSVQYWNGTSSAGSGACSPDRGVQIIKLNIHATDNRGSETIQLIKRRPT